MNRNSWQIQWRRALVIYRHWAEIFGSSRERTAHQQVTIFKTACYTQSLLCLDACLALEKKRYWKGIPAWGTLANVRSQKGEKCFLCVLLHLCTECYKAATKGRGSTTFRTIGLHDNCNSTVTPLLAHIPADTEVTLNTTYSTYLF